jgi:hypothetical protein
MSGGRDWVETLDLTTIIQYIARWPTAKAYATASNPILGLRA